VLRRPIGAWADVYDTAAAGEERMLVAALAAHDMLALPVIGAEGPDGIPLELSWPTLKVAVAVTPMSPQDRTDLAAAGWRVVDPSPDLVLAALADATARTAGGH
jgi:hypothetical protein